MQEIKLISPRDIDRYVDDVDSVPEEKFLVLYCDRGGASMEAGRYLAEQGYQVCSVVGGFMAYRGRNLVFSN